jgi:ankyrin repeat protein
MKKVIFMIILGLCTIAINMEASGETKAESILTASEEGDLAMVKKLLQADPSLAKVTNENGFTPMHKAAEKGGQTIMTVGKNGNITVSSKYSGEEDKYIQIIKLLIRNGANVNAYSKDGRTPLHLSITWDNYDIAELLISNGADVNAGRGNYGPPLIEAAARGLIKSAELLLSKGADINALDKRNMTPLDWAIDYNQHQIGEFLKSKGARRGKPKSAPTGR